MTVANDPTASKRLRILEPGEIDALYARPTFTPDERSLSFTLTAPERAALSNFRSLPSQLAFILQLGYFKAKRLFFPIVFTDVADDVAAVLTRHFPQSLLGDWPPLSKPTILKHRAAILDLFQYRLCLADERRLLTLRARQAAQLSSKPIYIFRELLQLLTEQRIVAPGYTVLQEIVGQAVTFEQQRLTAIVQATLTPIETAALDRLLTDDADGPYAITRLKREPADFSHKALRQEADRAAVLRPLAVLATRVIPRLAISPEGVAYYASLVAYYSAFRLQQLDRWICYLYLLCFARQRYHRTHDHLLTAFMHGVAQVSDETAQVAKDQAVTQRLERTADLTQAGRVLQLFITDPPDPQVPFQRMQTQAFALLERTRLTQVANYLATKADIDEVALQWEQIERTALRWKRKLRPLLRAVTIASTRPNAPLLEAVAFLTRAFATERPLSQISTEMLPSQWIPVRLKRYLYTQDTDGDKRLIPDRYEALVYRLLRNGLASGDLVCHQSVQFRSFADELLSDEQWQDKATLLERIGLSLLQQPIQRQLADLEAQLEERLRAVNARIASGDNAHVQVTRRRERLRWTLAYPRDSEPVNHPRFDAVPQVDISRVLAFADAGCGLHQAFTHVLGRYVQHGTDAAVLRACIVAWGTNMGLGRMGEISDLSAHVLARVSENYLRPETLKAANDQVSNAIAALPITRHYDLGAVIHSSSDGQKFETAIPTINARYSPKYFGLHKGIVAYTLVANHIPVNARIIGAHEHESHYVFDLLFNNTTVVQPTVHSTDTHGTNEVNFALLHVLGYQFAPRYRNIQEKVRTGLYGFQHPRHYTDLLLRPIRKLNTELIVAEWDNLLRIFASLALKTTTQSIIVRKLNAYTRRNKTQQALWEYDNIIRSLYLLEYIDSPPLRQNVQRALNRGENYHQLRRAVAYANFGKLRFKAEDEQVLWSECSRLITNCIVYYNATILSRLLVHQEAAGEAAGIAELGQISPVAWQHINLYGRYEFTRTPAPIDVDTMVAALAQRPR
jgi:TnpA family transposase